MGGYGGSYDYEEDKSVLKRSARSYNIDHDRRYEARSATPPPRNKTLRTEARLPVVIAVDVTASMSEWPSIIFEKLCVLYNEAKLTLPDDLKEDFEISFVAVGDAYCDNYPIQVQDFGKEEILDDNIKQLYPEGGGGGQTKETYELVAYYYATHCEMPNALDTPKPIFIFIGDEGYYSKVKKSFVDNYIGDTLNEDLDSQTVFDRLKEKFSVYMLRLAYKDSTLDGRVTRAAEPRIQKDWKAALGPERVILMEHPERAVDIILGIIASEVDAFDAFASRIELRQTPEQVQQVYDILSDRVKGVLTRTKKN